ncbi:MAG TPA: hypothetical protein VKU61_14805 [Candidatus Binatia bacterium]|nr:hypothetical protein [Candidatus Binatia bacterium]
MEWLKRGFRSDALYELLVITWIVASPLAIARWVERFDDPVSWAAFIAGVIGVIVGWLIVAPYQDAKNRSKPPPVTAD